MLHQEERVPKHYELIEAAESKTPQPSVTLRSADGNDTERHYDFYFEALRPNVFRTSFTGPEHPLPPHPSAQRPAPSFGTVTPEVSTEDCSRVIRCGKIKAVVNWSGPPVVQLFNNGDQEPLHADLPFRSYAIDSTGIAHYTAYKRDTLHVGLGEKAGPMDLSGRNFTISASDTFGYDAYRTDPLYKHIPLLINVTPHGCIGIFSTSLSRGTWAVGSELDGMWGRFKVYRQAYGGLEEYLIVGDTAADVVRSYAELVGFPLLVPRYMMGYIAGGMKYTMLPRSDDVILDFIRKSEKEGMPCTAFQMSSGYTIAETEPQTRNVFTWNRQRFPDPQAWTSECHQHGVRLLANIKPYVLANHPDYPRLVKEGAFYTDPTTSGPGIARLWSAGGATSGEGSHVDFTSKAGYEWWFQGVRSLKGVGIDAMWNDNNEFTIPCDDWECALETIKAPDHTASEGAVDKRVGLWGRALHTELMGKSSHDATIEAEPDVRPLVLTRSATAGTMRYCASSWSGDNVTSWEGMRGANALALNAGFSLIQCYGHDIGGFEGPQPTPEHLVRWIQLGIHSPRFAINCYKTGKDSVVGDVIEPWQYPSVSPIIRTAIRRRYELVPYTYSLMLQSHRDATPPQRWTGWGYESDSTVWSKELFQGDSQYWFGDALLIAGVYKPGLASARVYLPRRSATDPGFLNLNAPYQYLAAGQWHEIESPWYTSIPVLARIGSAVPVGKSQPTTCLPEADLPGLAKDDWRGVEIFPPPVMYEKSLSKGHGVQWFCNQWLEDDGISCEKKAQLCEATIKYGVSDEGIQVSVSLKKHGDFAPLWVTNGVSVILPVGEDRPVRLIDGQEGIVEDAGRDEKGRCVCKLRINVVAE